MPMLLPILALLMLAGLLGLLVIRLRDVAADRAEWRRLTALQPARPARFTPDMVADLPEPARRYFGYVIAPGTPLLPVAEIDMSGEFSLGSKEKPGYRPMKARQILASPHGFVWSLRLPGGVPVSGSDSGSWTRFRLFGLVPVARLGGDRDHARSAFGRHVAESVFWTPAALLPGPGITWEAPDADTARVTLRHAGMEQAVDIALATDGRPERVIFQRWSDANPEKRYRLQPFGGEMSDFRDVDGYRLPFRVVAGNMFGTEAYFPFFLAEVTAIRFPRLPG